MLLRPIGGPAVTASRRLHLYSLFWGLVAFALDRGHKYWQVDLQGWSGGEYVQVTDFFDYVLVWNTGISYGLLGEMPVLALGALILVAILALAFWWWKASQPLVQVGLMLCIGGALSNALDRILYGAVADFFHFHWQAWSFYIFNIADVMISLGVLLLILDLIGIGRPRQAAVAE
jgi:signal peptidase II